MVGMPFLLDTTKHPTVRREDEMAKRLDEAPLPVHPPLLKFRGELAGPLGGRRPQAFEHGPCVAQTLHVGRPELDPLGEAAVEFGVHKLVDLDAVDRQDFDVARDVGAAKVGGPSVPSLAR